MVKENRFVFEASDLSYLIYACTNCDQEVSYRLDEVDCQGFAVTCGSCSQQLKRRMNPTLSDDDWFSLIRIIQKLRQDTGSPVRIKFVVSDESE